MFLHAEGDFDVRSDWAGCQRLRYEVRDGLTLDGILLVVQGEDDLCGVLEVLGWGVGREEMPPNEEQKFQEGLEQDFPAVAFALGATSVPEA